VAGVAVVGAPLEATVVGVVAADLESLPHDAAATLRKAIAGMRSRGVLRMIAE
jgi:hypothetical protein